MSPIMMAAAVMIFVFGTAMFAAGWAYVTITYIESIILSLACYLAPFMVALFFGLWWVFSKTQGGS